MSSVAELRGVSKTYRRGAEEIHALDDVSLDIDAGELVAVVGPSGSGKTTLLNLLGCVDSPTSGELRVGGRDATRLGDRELARLRQSFIGFVFQQFFLVPTLTAEENVLMPTLFSHRRCDARQLLDLVGLGERAGHRPAELSGGEMQRVAIARALVNEPKLLLADEPTGNLDSERAEKIFALLRQIGARGTAVVIVTHNDELARAADRVIRLRDGRLALPAPH
ncbi:MAG: ABC transporter ATP-binding protein [Kofleriaceae bacterium]|nr:ABC transporter ATP-binding protein [Kofleriaceae bacterium]